jgi:hypothetical protein
LNMAIKFAGFTFGWFDRPPTMSCVIEHYGAGVTGGVTVVAPGVLTLPPRA